MRRFDPKKIPLPKNFQDLDFPKNRKVIFEVGCGVGLHPIKYAQEHPDHFVVAFERTSEKFEKFQRRLLNHPEIKNITAIQGDALLWAAALPWECVDLLFILYPNPYPKKSQENLRFYAMPLFAALVNLLKVGGEIILATNESFYYQGAKEKLVENFGLKLNEDTEVTPDQIARTHFEKKYLARGNKCWNLKFQKKS